MRTAVIYLLAALVLMAPALSQTCATGCNCDANSAVCNSCKAGYKYVAAVQGGAAATCAVCDYRKGSAAANMATTCAVDCHVNCAQCVTADANMCLICRDGLRMTGVTTTNGLTTGTCMFCPAGKGRARLMAIPATVTEEPESICSLTCLASAGCCRCATTDMGGCINCQAGWRWNGSGTCAWCTGGMGKGIDPTSMWGSTTAQTNAQACTVKCTEPSCGTCSDTSPGVCLACAAGMTLKDGKCVSSGSSATILQTLCAVIATAYVMF